VLNHGSKLARNPHQLNVIDRSNRRGRIRGRDFHPTIRALVNHEVAKHDRANFSVGPDRSVS
jgi:hypothetical protein